MMQRPGLRGWPVALSAVLLAALVAAVFCSLLGFEFVEFDVYIQVIKNPHIRGLTAENVKHILTSRCITSYYPVRTLTYALDYQIWGLTPRGFKLTNLLIHTANTLLVFWLVLRLFRRPAGPRRSPNVWWDLGVATFSTGLFAVHPVVVEPVSWVAGREELLMTLGALGCLHFHLAARRLGQDGKAAAWACRAGAAFCCALACLSNAVAAVIPLLILAWDLLDPHRPRLWKALWTTSPLWLIAAATIVIKRIGESGGPPLWPKAFSAERAMLVLQVYWLNLKTLFWPARLSLYYNWVDPKLAQLILGGAAILLTVILLWKLRRQRLTLFGLVWFGVALAPASQIMPHHIQRADRFLYLPLVGLAVAVAISLRRLGPLLKKSTAAAGMLTAGLVLLLLAVRSFGQVQTWRNSLTAWETCLIVDPNNDRAHDALADNLATAGRFEEAIPHYELVLRRRPDCVETLEAYAEELATGEKRLRDYQRAIRLAHHACEVTQWESSEVRRTLAEAYASLAMDLRDRGHYGQAIQNYDRALRADPTCDLALFNLALLLTACPDQTLRRPQQAVQLAEEACRLVKSPGIDGWTILAAAYIEAGQYGRGAMATQKALELAQAAGDSALAQRLRRQLRLCQDRSP